MRVFFPMPNSKLRYMMIMIRTDTHTSTLTSLTRQQNAENAEAVYPYPIDHPLDSFSMVDFDSPDFQRLSAWPSQHVRADGILRVGAREMSTVQSTLDLFSFPWFQAGLNMRCLTIWIFNDLYYIYNYIYIFIYDLCIFVSQKWWLTSPNSPEWWSRCAVALFCSQDSMTSLMSRRSKSLWTEATCCTCPNIGGIRWHKAPWRGNCGGFSMVFFLETEKSVMFFHDFNGCRWTQ